VEPKIDFPVDRKDKIRELKFALKGAQQELKGLLDREIPSDSEEKQAFGKEVAQMRAIVMALVDELKTTRMNKNSSKFFEFTPSGSSRKMKRRFVRTRNLTFKKK
jgi:hypothetical protein